MPGRFLQRFVGTAWDLCSVEWMAVDVNLLCVMGVVGYKVSLITTYEVLPVLVRKEGEFFVLSPLRSSLSACSLLFMHT